MTEEPEVIDVRTLTRQLRANPYTGAVRNVSLRASLGVRSRDVYELLLDRTRHKNLVGKPVEIRPQVGTMVALDDGRADGYVTELLDGRHIVLAWRLVDDRWPPGHYSTVTFMMRDEGDGCVLVLFQQDVPTELAGEIAARWQADYLDSLAAEFSVRGDDG